MTTQRRLVDEIALQQLAERIVALERRLGEAERPAKLTALTLDALTVSDLSDQTGRWFLRTDTSRGGTQLVQFGVDSISTDANGDMVVTFPESFSTSPTCTATVAIGSSTQRTAQIQGAVSTSAVTFRLMNNGAAMASFTGGALHWWAIGFKDMT